MEKGKFNATAYKNEYASNNYDRISLVVPKGDKERIKEYAESRGEKINGYINRLIAEDMAKNK